MRIVDLFFCQLVPVPEGFVHSIYLDLVALQLPRPKRIGTVFLLDLEELHAIRVEPSRIEYPRR